MLSNLLQELSLAKEYGRKHIILDDARLSENPVQRLSRLIRDSFWDNLTRRIDASSIEKAGTDPKNWTDDPRPRIYVPQTCPEQLEYYRQVAKDQPNIRLDVQILGPNGMTPAGVRDLNAKPGLLALAMQEYTDPETWQTELQGEPFVVPGGRFNEMYGWDSYMESIGLIVDGCVDLAESMVRNFCFSIKHYGKIFNANRTYYLGRTQPPFVTDMVLRVYDKIQHEHYAIGFLREAILAAIKEYYSVFVCPPRLDPTTGLSRYYPEGLGVPPETEATHFSHVLEPYAYKYGMEYSDFVDAYNRADGTISESELDEYFLHDRAVRESGHDTSYRLERVAANLATIDLNSLLYKFETDIAKTIRTHFKDKLVIPAEYCSTAHGMKPGQDETAAAWDRRAKNRKRAVDRYMWNEEKGMYFDYDTVKKEQTTYETATTFWALWCGVATPHQAAALVIKALPKFEAFGGLVSGTEESRGVIGIDRPARQWDYPFVSKFSPPEIYQTDRFQGWAPEQILAWTGLRRYGFEEEAERLAYKWLYMVTKAFVDFNGIVVEKYDVTRPIDPHKVDAEYGNQGSDFKGVAREG